MEWLVTLDAVTKDPSNANIIATLTITNGADVRITEHIPGNSITNDWLAGLAAARIAIYQAREDAIAALIPGTIVPKPFVSDPVQLAIADLTRATQIAALKSPSTDPDVIKAQSALDAALAISSPMVKGKMIQAA